MSLKEKDQQMQQMWQEAVANQRMLESRVLRLTTRLRGEAQLRRQMRATHIKARNEKAALMKEQIAMKLGIDIEKPEEEKEIEAAQQGAGNAF